MISPIAYRFQLKSRAPVILFKVSVRRLDDKLKRIGH